MIGAILLAAGSGRRMKHTLNKPYIDLLGKPILAYSLEVFGGIQDLAGIILVIRPGDEALAQEALAASGVDSARVTLVAGGSERQESVLRALAQVPPAWSWVLIHDGARPFLSRDLIRRVLEGVTEDTATTPGLPVTDTLKKVDDQGMVLATVDRTRLMGVQTPQGFAVETIKGLHDLARKEGRVFTDDTGLYEAYGKKVKVVAGDPDNIKVTHPADLKKAHMILAEREA